ncbi:MAG: hypothetical protein KDJ73_10515 [Notoacmeibacter sp.]|nr:hypothetical protein [Notoacmeibacter sp.]MCC0032914.1 hypothetical protein [Brucellaceae bacterium]
MAALPLTPHHPIPAGDREFTRLFPMPVRLLLAGTGAFCVVIAIKELWRAVWPLNALSPFFLVIILGAIFVGSAFMLGAAFTGETRWTLGDGSLLLDTKNLFGRRHIEIRRHDVVSLTVREIEWDSREPTWCVALTLGSGETFDTPDYGKRAMAEEKRAAIAAALGLER